MSLDDSGTLTSVTIVLITAILTGFGMHCVHCPMSQMETLEEAGAVHGIDVELMVSKLNEGLK